MTYLDENQSQEHMEQWYRQLSNTDNPLLQTGALHMLKPTFHSCDFQKKEASFTFSTAPWETYADGSLHSGLATMSFDTALGLLCHYYAKQKMICTIHLSTAFMAPIPADKKVVFRGQILSFGKTLVTMRGEAFLAEDESTLLATADTTFMILNQNLSHKI